MVKTTKFETTSDASDFVGLLQIWDSLKSFKQVSKYALSLGLNEKKIFPGYIFFIETWLRAFLREINSCEYIPLENNYELYRASHRGEHISKISNSCEKIVFIRNYYKLIQMLKKSKNSHELSILIKKLDRFISAFSDNLNKVIAKNKEIKLSKKEAIFFSTMSRGIFLFNQFNNIVPEGRYFSLFRNGCTEVELEKSFVGYKVCLVYMWSRVLNKSQLKFVEGIEDAIDWSADSYANKYMLEHPEKFKTHESKMFPELKIKIPGNTLDCFFRIILDEIIEPLEKTKKTRIAMDAYFLFKQEISKKIFSGFLKNIPPKLTEKNIIDELFLWYSSEVIDSAKRNIFNGAAAFMIVLDGAVRWRERFNDSSPVQVLKIPHQVGENQHNYSYGVLIESRGTFGSDWSGWMMFFDICGDYSGFSGQEHAYIESLIKVHLDNNDIMLRSLEIGQDKLDNYLSKSSTERRIGQITNEHKKREEILKEARGMIVELLVYYLQTQIEGQGVQWGFENRKDGDIDIIIETKKIIKFVECKLNPSSCNMDDELKKIRNKSKSYSSTLKKKIEFWFWFEPDPSTIKLLKSKKIEYHVVSNELSVLPEFKNRNEKLNLILNSGEREPDFVDF